MRTTAASAPMPWPIPVAATPRSAPLRPPLSAELTRELTNTTLVTRRKIARTFIAHDFVRRPRAIEHVLELVQRRRPHSTSRPAKHREANGPIQRRQLLFGDAARELLGEP